MNCELTPGAAATGEIDLHPVPAQVIARSDDLVEGRDFETHVRTMG